MSAPSSRADRRAQVEAACATLRAACRRAGPMERVDLARTILDTTYGILDLPVPERHREVERPPARPAA